MTAKASSGGWVQGLTRVQKERRYVFRFETDGDNIPVNVVGWGIDEIEKRGTGTYRVHLNQACNEIVGVFPRIAGASGSNDDVVPVYASFNTGDADNSAYFDLEVQSAAGTAADLDGPCVMCEVVVSDAESDTIATEEV